MKWFFAIQYNNNRRMFRKRTRSSLLNILNFLFTLPLGAWRDIESVKIERLH